jgi:hypothetical protein
MKAWNTPAARRSDALAKMGGGFPCRQGPDDWRVRPSEITSMSVVDAHENRCGNLANLDRARCLGRHSVMDAYQLARPSRGVGRKNELISYHKPSRRPLKTDAAPRPRRISHGGHFNVVIAEAECHGPVSRHNDATLLIGPNNGTIAMSTDEYVRAAAPFLKIAIAVAGIGAASCVIANGRDEA